MAAWWWTLFVLWLATVGYGIGRALFPSKKPSGSLRTRPEPAWKVGARREDMYLGLGSSERKLRAVVFVYTKGYDPDYPALSRDCQEIIGHCDPTDRATMENLMIKAEKRQAELSDGFEYMGFLEQSLKREISFESS